MSEGIRRRWLNGWEASDEEWKRIDEVLEEHGWPALNRQTTKVRLAEEEGSGRLLGFLVLQLFPHTEPAWLEDQSRGKGIMDELVADMMEYLVAIQARAWEFTADSPHVVKYAEQYGLKKVESAVYRTG